MLVVARAVNVLGALGPLASSNVSPVGSRQMTASDPTDPVIAPVSEGFGSLLVHCADRPDAVLSPTPGAARMG